MLPRYYLLTFSITIIILQPASNLLFIVDRAKNTCLVDATLNFPDTNIPVIFYLAIIFSTSQVTTFSVSLEFSSTLALLTHASNLSFSWCITKKMPHQQNYFSYATFGVPLYLASSESSRTEPFQRTNYTLSTTLVLAPSHQTPPLTTKICHNSTTFILLLPFLFIMGKNFKTHLFEGLIEHKKFETGGIINKKHEDAPNFRSRISLLFDQVWNWAIY